MPEWSEAIFLKVWILNVLIAFVYLLWGILVAVPARERQTEKKWERLFDNRRAILIKFVIMILCPIIGLLFFLASYLLGKVIFWIQPDLEDVIFSKERVRIQLKADEERARSMVPLEEALVVNEKKDLRRVIMNMVKGEMQDSLASIALALKSEDSEASHYAASVLTDELNEFHKRVQDLQGKMKEEAEGDTAAEEALMDYVNQVLRLKVLDPVEQKRYAGVLSDAAEQLYGKDASRLTACRYEGVCLRLLEAGEETESEKWCLRLAGQYPVELAAYTCRLKLYFTQQKREAFFAVLSELRQSEVVVDRETLELIRVFS